MANVLYVARRAFKSRGVLYEVGQVIENPSSITLLRSRILDRDVLELFEGDKHNGAWLDYLKARAKKPLDPRVIKMCGGHVEVTPVVAKTPVAPQKTVTPVAKPATTVKPTQAVKPSAKK